VHYCRVFYGLTSVQKEQAVEAEAAVIMTWHLTVIWLTISLIYTALFRSVEQRKKINNTDNNNTKQPKPN
jgi:preprotein translocase subunit SecG